MRGLQNRAGAGQASSHKPQGRVLKKVRKSFISWLLAWTLVLTGIGAGLPQILASAETGDGLAADARVGESEFSVTSEQSWSSGWVEYLNWKITNHTTAAVTGVQVVLPISSKPNPFKAWNLAACYNEEIGGAVIYYTGEIAAGATVTIGEWDSQNYKLGFSPDGVTIGDAYVRGVNCEAPTSGIAPENDDYHPADGVTIGGGSGSSGGDSSGGNSSGSTSGTTLNYELTGATKEVTYADTPFGKHGKLHLATVEGYGNAPIIVDQYGKPFQLRGASTHGLHWGEMTPYVNKDSFQSLRDEWGVNLVRLVSYVTQGGYTQGSQPILDETIQNGVEIAKELGLYVIIDWHIHAENPHDTKSQAETFFTNYASKYKDYDNVIFEICNEPTGVEWYNESGRDLYSYCKDIVSIIRNAGSNALIVCGTNTWSQDVQDVVKKPLAADGYSDILYTLHFYAATHRDELRSKLKQANADGTPIFVTEFGICSADGNGNYDTASADTWIQLCDDYNISYACWSLCNKAEAASYLKNSCTKQQGGWTAGDLSTTGTWLVNTYRAHQDKENETDTSKGYISATTIPGSQGGNSTDPSGADSQGGDIPGSTGEDNQGGSTPGTTGTGDQGGSIPGSTGSDPSTVNPGGSTAGDDSTLPTSTTSADSSALPPSSVPGNTATQASNSPVSGNESPQMSASPAPGNTSTQASTSPVPGTTSTQAPVSSVPGVVSTPIPTSPALGDADGGSDTSSANTVKLRLKKNTIKIKKGKKAKIVIKKKSAGDKVRKYKILGSKKIVSVTKKGVVKGKKKGKVTVQVIMKSGAKAKCKIVVR